MKCKNLSVFLCLTLLTALLAGFGSTMAANRKTVSPKTVSGNQGLFNSTKHTCKSGTHVDLNNEKWEPLDRKNLSGSTLGNTETPSYYYLTSNVTISAEITVQGEVYICLNGYTIDADNKCRIFKVCDSALCLYDCKGKGELTNGYGKNGGAIYVDTTSTITVENCTICDCEATGNGGAIYAEAGAAVAVTDSTVTNCKAQCNGGALYIENTLYLSGLVRISGNFAGNCVDNVYFTKNAADVNSLSIAKSGLNENSYIGIHCANGTCRFSCEVTDTAPLDYSSLFFSDNGQYVTTYDGHHLYLKQINGHNTTSPYIGRQQLELDGVLSQTVYLKRVGLAYTIQYSPNGQYLAVKNGSLTLSTTPILWYIDRLSGLCTYSMRGIFPQYKVYLHGDATSLFVSRTSGTAYSVIDYSVGDPKH